MIVSSIFLFVLDHTNVIYKHVIWFNYYVFYYSTLMLFIDTHHCDIYKKKNPENVIDVLVNQ